MAKDNEAMIEVLGIGFPNKGAELMLSTVQERMRSNLGSEARLVLQTHHPFSARRRYGAYQKYWTERGALERGRVTEIFPKSLLQRFGVVRDSEIDAVLDCSGFAYGDQWKAKKAQRRLGRNVARWKRAGRKIILMPQSFGPFGCPRLRKVMREILKHVDLVFARDRISHAALTELAPGSSVIRASPDMTFGLLPHGAPGANRACRGVAVIPNEKMVGLGGHDRDAYIAGIAGLVTRLLQANMSPFLLLHEGDRDRRICSEIRNRVQAAVPLVAPSCPVEIKRVIGECAFVLTSRYHGFVSALSQGVPCAATSWSHKYEALAEEFESPELIVSTDDPDFVETVAAMVEGEGTRRTQSVRFARVAEQKRRQVEQMWKEVWQVVKDNPLAPRADT